MNAVNQWEAVWAEYVDALDNYDADWSGEDFVIDIAKAKWRIITAQRQLRTLDAAFCKRLGI
jgi:hypothetical protein